MLGTGALEVEDLLEEDFLEEDAFWLDVALLAPPSDLAPPPPLQAASPRTAAAKTNANVFLFIFLLTPFGTKRACYENMIRVV